MVRAGSEGAAAAAWVRAPASAASTGSGSAEKPLSEPIEFLPGALITASYRLVRRLGEGGMGVVWEAERTDTRERVAVKLLKETGEDPHARRQLLREARAVSTVDHPNVVRVLEVLELAGGSPAIVVELLEGEPLSDRLRRQRCLGLRELADILAPVTSAVGTAHALGIVHRDLKPENIFLSRRAGAAIVPKVLDFGIAKLTALDGEAIRSSVSSAACPRKWRASSQRCSRAKGATFFTPTVDGARP